MAKMLLSYKDPDPRRALFQWTEQMDKETPRWIDGASVKRCTHCHDTSKKRHNCRLCGLMFCSMCSGKYHLPAKYALKNKRLNDGSIAPMRVCWGCYENAMRFKFKVSKAKGHLVDQMMDRKKHGHMFVPIWQSMKDDPKCLRCDTTQKCRICRGCGFVFCSNSSCSMKMSNIPKAFEKDPALQGKTGPGHKTHMCLQCRWHIVSGDIKLLELSRNEYKDQAAAKKNRKNSSVADMAGGAALPGSPSLMAAASSHSRSFSVTSRGSVLPPATFMRIKEDELMERELLENAGNKPIKIGEGGLVLEVRWEHDGDNGYVLCSFDCPPDTPLNPMAQMIVKKQLIPPHVTHHYTCRGKIIPSVLYDLFTAHMLKPVLYIRRGLSMPNSNYYFDEPDSKYNLVYEDKSAAASAAESGNGGEEADPDSQNSASSVLPPSSPSNVGIISGIRSIRCATLHKLVEKVTREASTDLELRFVFFLTYPSFCRPTELLECLWSRYNIPEPPGLEHMSRDDVREFRSRARRIQIKVFSVLKYWMDEYWSDFTSREMQRATNKLVLDLQTVPSAAEDPNEPTSQRPLSLKFADDIRVLMEKRRDGSGDGGAANCNGSGLLMQSSTGSNPSGLSNLAGSSSSAGPSSASSSGSVSSSSSSGGSSSGSASSASGSSGDNEDGTDYPALLMPFNLQPTEIEAKFSNADIKGWEHEIARQLMLVDFSVFSKIRPREFLDNAWSGKSKDSKAPNIVRMIAHFNKVCSWVQTTVLGSPTTSGRAKLIQSFIKMAEHCGELNNFNSMFAIYCALKANPVHRLKRTLDLLKAKSLKRLDAIKVLFQADSNSRNYRDALRHVTKACTPHLGIFLTDLIYIHDGNPDSMLGMINMKKRRLLADRVRWIKQYQQLAPRFRPIPGVQAYFETHLVAKTEDELWQLSNKVESRSKPGQ